MATITDLKVSLNEAEEYEFHKEGYNKLPGDLNQCTGGDCIYLWYKTGDSQPITRIQFSFNDGMCGGLISAGYFKIPKNLNAGTKGDCIYLWFYKGSSEYDVPITELYVSTTPEDGAKHFSAGWERLACDLNRGCGGSWIYLFVKRQSQAYICDLTATDSSYEDYDNFTKGFIRVDEDTNRGAGGKYVFIWFRYTTDISKAIRDVRVSTTGDEYEKFLADGYQVVGINLNKGTCGNKVFMWFKNTVSAYTPIKAISVLVNPLARQKYIDAGTVIVKNLNSGNYRADDVVLCYNNKK